MPGDPNKAAVALNRRYLLDFPLEAATSIEKLRPQAAATLLEAQPADVLVLLWQYLTVDAGASLLLALPETLRAQIVSAMLPNEALRFLGAMDDARRQACLDALDPDLARELTELMTYPEDSAGRLMDTRPQTFRLTASVSDALETLRQTKARSTRSLFLVDDEGKLAGRVLIQDLALAEGSQRLSDLARPLTASVTAVSSRQEVAETMERHQAADLPVVDLNGVLLGVVYNATLVQAVQAAASAGLQTMVGASRDERALSKPLFAVRKRMPWLQINLLTAFLAAAVVGLFEETIAQFTALAVLLPVVAGQSGNAGAQALAVTMRGLALREITIRHWFSVMVKEVIAGFANGLAIAVTCGIGVFVWSGSVGLVLVIALSMVLAMISAGFAGALVPIMLTRLGQDPAQASSIILTTVTDIAGFLSFLGIATLLSGML